MVESPRSVQAWADLLNAFPERFLFGSDSVAPANPAAYLKTYRDYQPLWEQLNESASRKTRYGNYERLFDAANRKVRDWEGRRNDGGPNSASRK